MRTRFETTLALVTAVLFFVPGGLVALSLAALADGRQGRMADLMRTASLLVSGVSWVLGVAIWGLLWLA